MIYFNCDYTEGAHPRIIRICTSWATKEENVTALLADIERVRS